MLLRTERTNAGTIGAVEVLRRGVAGQRYFDSRLSKHPFLSQSHAREALPRFHQRSLLCSPWAFSIPLDYPHYNLGIVSVGSARPFPDHHRPSPLSFIAIYKISGAVVVATRRGRRPYTCAAGRRRNGAQSHNLVTIFHTRNDLPAKLLVSSSSFDPRRGVV